MRPVIFNNMRPVIFVIAASISAFGQETLQNPILSTVSTLPATCAQGQQTSLVTAGIAQNYQCSATNTWTAVVGVGTDAIGSTSGSVTLNATGPYNVFTLTVTGATTLATSNWVAGQYYEVQVTQDATGSRTVNWPSGFNNVCVADPLPASVTVVSGAWTGTALQNPKCVMSTAAYVTTIADPGVNPASGQLFCWSDSTINAMACRDSSGNRYQMPKITSGKQLTVTNTITLTGTDSQTYTFPATSQTIPGLSQAQTWTGVNTFGAGAFYGQMWTPIINTSDSTDQLTSSGSVQYFSLNSGAANVAASVISGAPTGTRFDLQFQLDLIDGGTPSNDTWTVVASSAACSGTTCASPVQLAKSLASQSCTAASATCSTTIKLTCYTTGTAGTVNCAPVDRLATVSASQQSGIITGFPTSGTVYFNVGYNQVTQSGNKASITAAIGTWY